MESGETTSTPPTLPDGNETGQRQIRGTVILDGQEWHERKDPKTKKKCWINMSTNEMSYVHPTERKAEMAPVDEVGGTMVIPTGALSRTESEKRSARQEAALQRIQELVHPMDAVSSTQIVMALSGMEHIRDTDGESALEAVRAATDEGYTQERLAGLEDDPETVVGVELTSLKADLKRGVINSVTFERKKAVLKQLLTAAMQLQQRRADLDEGEALPPLFCHSRVLRIPCRWW